MRLKFGAFFLLLIIVSSISYAMDHSFKGSPIVVEANKLQYYGSDENRRVIATGDVEITQDNQKIFANFIEYDYSTDAITAKDEVKLFEKTGYIINADNIFLKDKMKYGNANNLLILTPDKATIKAKSASKEDNRWTNIKEGFFTSCKMCEGKEPIWNISSSKATLDEKENRMSYKNAFMHFYGKPILYTPFFSHFTSKAKRQSGLLTPTYGGSTYLGLAVKVPYYINLAPNYDATITPVFTSKRGEALEGEYRHLFSSGQINTKGSITSAKRYQVPSGQAPLSPDIRYNFHSKTNLAISNNKNIGWNINTTSDKSYLQDYGYGSGDSLMSRVYNNSYQRNGYYEVQAMSFQNLRPETSSTQNQMHQTPMVMPLFESKHLIHKFSDDSEWLFESNMLKIHRYAGADSNRFSIKNTWKKSLLLSNGHNFKFFASLRDDLYYYNNAPINNNNYSGYTSRHIPEAGIAWDYPLANKIGDNFVVISPVVSAIATPYTHYNRNIYNEDSGDSNEINDTNIFNDSQFNGMDLVENTPRVSYGIKADVYHQDNFKANALFGQMYQQKPQRYLSDSGSTHVSDYVGRIKFDFIDKLFFEYQYTLDNQSLKNKTNELSTVYKYKKAYVRSDLLYYRNNIEVNDIKNRRELFFETGINDYKDFSFSTHARRSLTSKKDNPTLDTPASGFVSFGAKIKYDDECLLYTFSVERDLTRNKDKKQNTSVLFKVILKSI